MSSHTTPEKIENFSDFLGVKWNDKQESFIDAFHLRNCSPSAEQKGERDIFGNKSNVSHHKLYEAGEVKINNFEKVGNYAIRIYFSDGHKTGIYSWSTLLKIDRSRPIPDCSN